jgi:hypothetical protein
MAGVYPCADEKASIIHAIVCALVLTSGAVFGPDAVQATKDKIAQRVADFDFRVENRTIANVTARCLVTTRKPDASSDPTLGASATLCISPEGVILQIETPGGTESAVDYTTTIPGDAFALPAPVSSTKTSSASSSAPASGN